MATDKNITMKQFNGTDYDTLYPKTIASQIPDVYSKSYIDSILKDSARIQIGSYVGTGTYGVDNPCTLTFDFIPKVLFLENIETSGPQVYPYIWGGTFIETSNGGLNTIKFGTTISWFSQQDASRQLNYLDRKYGYVAIG